MHEYNKIRRSQNDHFNRIDSFDLVDSCVIHNLLCRHCATIERLGLMSMDCENDIWYLCGSCLHLRRVYASKVRVHIGRAPQISLTF